MLFPAFVLTAALTATMPAAATTAHVRNWEAAAKETKSIFADVTHTRSNQLLKRSNETHGSVLIEKPNRGVLRLDAKPPTGRKPDPNDYWSAIWTGKECYYYDGPVKTVTEFGPTGEQAQPKTPEEWLGRWFAALAQPPLALRLLDGSIPANGLNDRFLTRLLKTDENYVYLELTPRTAADRAEFDRLIVVLHGPKVAAPATPYTLRTAIVRKHHGQEDETGDFTNVTSNAPIEPKSFEYVPPPSDWKVHRALRPKS